MTQVVFDFPPSVFSAVRKAPAEFAEEMRLAAAIHWYSQGTISQGKAAEIAGVSRAEFLEELFHRKIPAIQVTLDELRQELAGGKSDFGLDGKGLEGDTTQPYRVASSRSPRKSKLGIDSLSGL